MFLSWTQFGCWTLAAVFLGTSKAAIGVWNYLLEQNLIKSLVQRMLRRITLHSACQLAKLPACARQPYWKSFTPHSPPLFSPRQAPFQNGMNFACSNIIQDIFESIPKKAIFQKLLFSNKKLQWNLVILVQEHKRTLYLCQRLTNRDWTEWWCNAVLNRTTPRHPSYN